MLASTATTIATEAATPARRSTRRSRSQSRSVQCSLFELEEANAKAEQENRNRWRNQRRVSPHQNGEGKNNWTKLKNHWRNKRRVSPHQNGEGRNNWAVTAVEARVTAVARSVVQPLAWPSSTSRASPSERLSRFSVPVADGGGVDLDLSCEVSSSSPAFRVAATFSNRDAQTRQSVPPCNERTAGAGRRARRSSV